MSKGAKSSGGVVAAESWLKLADDAFGAFTGVSHGQKEDILIREAARHGISPQTLRRLLSGRHFLNRLLPSEPGLAQALRTVSFAAVEVIARWHRWDQRGAAEAARALLSEGTSVRNLAVAEQEARRARGNTRVQRLPGDVASHIAESIVTRTSTTRGRQLRVTWASHSYRMALTKLREPAKFAQLRELRIAPSGISLILADDTSAPEIAVSIVTRNARVNGFTSLAQLAGLHHWGFDGLLVTFEPNETNALAQLANAFFPARLEAIILDPELLLGLPPEDERASR